jgi:hypothetical protein
MKWIFTIIGYCFVIHSFLTSKIDKINIVVIIPLQIKHKGQNAQILNVSWYIKYPLKDIQPIHIAASILKCFFNFPNNQSIATNKITGYTNIAIAGKGTQYILDKGFSNTVEQESVSFISQNFHPAATSATQ